MNFDQSPNRRTRPTIELRPLKVPVNGILHKDNSSQNPTQVRHVGHMRPEPTVVWGNDTPYGDRYAEPKQIFGAHRYDHEEHQYLVRKQERKRRCNAKSTSRRTHYCPAKRIGVLLEPNRIGKHAREYLAYSSDYPTREIENQKALAAQGLFNRTAE